MKVGEKFLLKRRPNGGTHGIAPEYFGEVGLCVQKPRGGEARLQFPDGKTFFVHPDMIEAIGPGTVNVKVSHEVSDVKAMPFVPKWALVREGNVQAIFNSAIYASMAEAFGLWFIKELAD